MFYNLTIQAIEGIYIFLIVLGIAALIALIAFLIHRFLHFRLKENEKPDDKEILKEEMDRILTPIDEEGRLKQNTANLIGSYLYKTDVHNQPIVGNVLFVGEEWNNDGIDFCGLEEETFKLLELELHNMIMAMKATMEVLK